jgi:hypothetical protein
LEIDENQRKFFCASINLKENSVVLIPKQQDSDVSNEVYELSMDEQENVAGGPEVGNDPGHG